MREHHGPVGDVFTYGLSTMAENPLPGGEAYRDYDPVVITVDVDTPDIPWPARPFGPPLEIPTPDLEVLEALPLPAGNLSNFDDRWGWIENDMCPLPGPPARPGRHPRVRLTPWRNVRRTPQAADLSYPVADERFRRLRGVMLLPRLGFGGADRRRLRDRDRLGPRAATRRGRRLANPDLSAVESPQSRR